MNRDDTPLLIVGGGIGGLTLALACARLHLNVHILEANEVFSESGAGIQLGPNATRILADLNALVRVREQAVEPDAIVARSGKSGRTLARLPLGERMHRRFGAPYLVVHRADLQSALLAEARECSGIEITTGFRATDIDQSEERVRVTASSGATATGSAIVAADGLWSRLRSWIAPDWALGPSSTTAARTLVTRDDAPLVMRDNVVGTWFSPKGHLVHYPVRNGQTIAIVVIARRGVVAPGWGHPIDASDVDADMARIAPAIPTDWVRGCAWRQWPLFDAPALSKWTSGRVALLGDAAHPILPFLAQGGAMAIEDAAALSREFASPDRDVASAFVAYAEARRTRTRNVQAASRRNGRIYHLTGAAALARDATMRLTPGSALISTYDWLYGWTISKRARSSN
ncbi:MAG: FAD-dependent monooxygenase [Pseudomonadota bacterium]